ncbi:coiled-coil domain-containing protein 43 isoform X1 [Rissa tridactyla]|uniref:coiled-coil domain-containing protein 43 isoform X1 n=1 Tax=Rissa tridactyla TaxID=75485 RepID=UPI0023BB06EA|nr:coiled-coil domain-containing protein 43 isoform X1 [Rissa tridactyla]
MAAPGGEAAGGFAAWLAVRLEALGLDRAVYGAYIEGLLRGEESDEERLEALRGVLAACLEEDLLNDVCREVVEKWSESQIVDAKEKKEDELQAIASMMEKQARIVVKPKEVSQEEKQRKAALLAQYANVTDEEDGEDEQDGSIATAVNIGSEKCILRILSDPGFLVSFPAFRIRVGTPCFFRAPFKFGGSFFFPCNLTLLVMPVRSPSAPGPTCTAETDPVVLFFSPPFLPSLFHPLRSFTEHAITDNSPRTSA